MNVLQVNHRYWPFRGGSESYFGRLSRDLIRAGHGVTVLTTDAYDLDHLWATGHRHVECREEIVDGALVRRFPVHHPLRHAYWQLTLKRLSRDSQRIPAIGWGLSRRLSRWSPAVPDLYRHLAARHADDTVVHAGNILFDGLVEAALLSARRRRLPCAITPFLHLGEPGSSLRRDYTSPRQIALLRSADLVIVQTPAERDWLIARGVSPERLVVAPDGPDLEELAGGDGTRTATRGPIGAPFVFFLGPTVADKGFFHLVDAVELLIARGEQIALIAAGPLTAAGRARLTDLSGQAAERIRHVGIVSDGERNDLLAACALVALPSRTESLGRAVLEGWYYEKPAIAARAGGLAEVVADGEDGLLHRFGDVAGLAETIRRVTQDRDLAARLGAAGRAKLLASFQWSRSATILIDAFSGLEAAA